MAGEYYSDAEIYGSGQALPPSSDSQFHTPIFSRSRRSSRYGTSSPALSSSPPPLPRDQAKDGNDTDGDFSMVDPRRFTPTLHASLVAEILSLRRDLDAKHRFIEDLENNLQSTRADRDAQADHLAQSLRDNRAAKRQLQQIESTTLATIEELVRERDEARDVHTDLRAKIDARETKVRALEEDVHRTQQLWDTDKEAWVNEKRSFERRVHVAESRLKVVLDELTAQQQQLVAAEEESHAPGLDSDGEDESRDSGLGHESDSNSTRSLSRTGSIKKGTIRHGRNASHGSIRRTPSLRCSLRSGSALDNYIKSNGISLADELVFDEEDEYYMDDIDEDGDEYTEEELRARRVLESRQSIYPDDKAKRILGLTTTDKGANIIDTSSKRDKVRGTRLDSGFTGSSALQHDYVDMAVQCTPPQSPTQGLAGKPTHSMIDHPSSPEHGANQRRKRTTMAVTVDRAQSPAFADIKLESTMVTSSCQTVEEIPSPDEIREKFTARPETPPPTPQVTAMVTTSTQTDITNERPKSQTRTSCPNPPKTAIHSQPLPPASVPAIAIHPASRPSSPGLETVLPPGTKNVACQTLTKIGENVRSISVQTEEIRLDMRKFNLPVHLLPSAILTSLPPSEESDPPKPLVRQEESTPRSWRADAIPSSPPMFAPPSPPAEDRYPGKNDNGRLSDSESTELRRPFRTSSLFAGFENESFDEDIKLLEYTDPNDFGCKQTSLRKAQSVQRTLGKGRFANPPTPVPEDKEPPSEDRQNAIVDGSDRSPSPTPQRMAPSRRSLDRISRSSRSLKGSIHGRQQSMRRSAMIQNGTYVHMQRSRSPSLGSVGSSSITTQNTNGVKPPFPVPDRSSSRRLFGASKSEGSSSPTPHRGSGMFASRRNHANRSPTRKDSLRKVRSAAVMPRHSRRRSPSPPLPSVPSLPSLNRPPVSPELRHMPKTSISSSQFEYAPARTQSSTPSVTVTSYQGSLGETSRPTIVDAIAATMVGEWMWKYVRRRKSFAVGAEQEFGRDEGAASISANGSRHKRWVWLSPYERSIMWSNKQPTSGTALMGKNGRKLVIQSVLDVRDDTPSPKGSNAANTFNRSILILTPTRALKFTTFTKERHYLWLTALSFLAHSPHGIPDLGSIPAVPEHELNAGPHARAALRQTPIRDSVLLFKGRPRQFGGTLPRNMSMLPSSTAYDSFPSAGPGDRPPSPSEDAAEPPDIPRHKSNHYPYHTYHGHSRKRSSTGPSSVPPNIRSFSHNQIMHSATGMSAASDGYGIPPLPSLTIGEPGYASIFGNTTTITTGGERTGDARNISGGSSINSLVMSSRTSDAGNALASRRRAASKVTSSQPHLYQQPQNYTHHPLPSLSTTNSNSIITTPLLTPTHNFFEDSTLRMEAYVVEPGGVSLEAPSPHVRTGRRRVSTNFARESGAPTGTIGVGNRGGVVYTDDFDVLDPFKGF